MDSRLAIAALLLLASASSAAADGGKVAVALYYESLCPYSARFVVNHLAKVFADGLREVVDLTLVPYGNARIHPGGEISCQVVRRPIRSSRFLVQLRPVRSCDPSKLDYASWVSPLAGILVNMIRDRIWGFCYLVLR
jgi:hypothetical protein